MEASDPPPPLFFNKQPPTSFHKKNTFLRRIVTLLNQKCLITFFLGEIQNFHPPVGRSRGQARRRFCDMVILCLTKWSPDFPPRV